MILEQHLLRFGTQENLILYVDGGPALEKQHTAEIRKEKRDKAAVKCTESLNKLEEIINSNNKPRKRHFTDVRTNLTATFYWSSQDRQLFITYMQQAGWSVRICETEADVAIAFDCQVNDIVISSDSDLLAYGTVHLLWRPISKYLVLAYKLTDLRQQLGLSEHQLTALATVSSNDYNKNIYSLGPATNYSIIKNLPTQDTRSIVAAYLSLTKVSDKNVAGETFEDSLRVFVDKRQTPCNLQDASSPDLLYDDLCKRFGDLQSQYEEVKKGLVPDKRTSTEQIVRLKSPQTPNRFKTVESPVFIKARQTAPQASPLTPSLAQPAAGPPPQQLLSTTQCPSPQEQLGHPPLLRTRIPKNRSRYSFKRHDRTQTKKRLPPVKMKQYVEKPFKEPDPKTLKATPKSKPKPKLKTLSDSTAATHKLEITKLLAYQHPTTSLHIGTLSANIQRALPNQAGLQQEVMDVLQMAVSEAARIKRQSQILIGTYIELLDRNGLQSLDAKDRKFLDLLCARVSMKDVTKDTADAVENDRDEEEIAGTAEEEEQEGDDVDDTDIGGLGGDDKAQLSFLSSFLSFLYNGNFPRKPDVANFINHLQSLGLYNPPQNLSGLKNVMPFTSADLLRSVVRQLEVELKRMYKRGTCELHNRLKKAKPMRTTAEIQIRGDISAIENYLMLNKLTQNPRRMVPITASKQPFVGFTERELTGFFLKSGGNLRESLLELAKKDGVHPTITDVQNWIGEKEPGFLIKHFVADIDPPNLTSRQRGKIGCRAKIKLWPLGRIRSHLCQLEDPGFQPGTYDQTGYISRGSLLTDGFRLCLLAFKLKELQSVRYRRLPEDRLPLRIMSTVGGTDYYLQEIRNIVKTKDDIAQLFPNVDPHDIKILTLDAGQAFVIGAYAYLPEDPDAHYNLAVNQKAVFQPVFRHRRWQEGEKDVTPSQFTRSIANIESELPPLRGPGASVVDYANRLEAVKEQLSEFYNGNKNRFRKHGWDKDRAMQAEYQAIATSLLGIVGGSIGQHRHPANSVLIGVGLGQFKSTGHLSSLHSSFLDYFIPLARSLGYIVVGVNEYYTSKKCPDCKGFVAQVTLRQLFCPNCGKYHHRDVMAAENMSRIVRGYLEKQKRPPYLQPRRADGSYPWEEDTAMSSSSSRIDTGSTSSDASMTSSSSINTPQSRKRTSSVSNRSDGLIKRKAK